MKKVGKNWRILCTGNVVKARTMYYLVQNVEDKGVRLISLESCNFTAFYTIDFPYENAVSDLTFIASCVKDFLNRSVFQ